MCYFEHTLCSSALGTRQTKAFTSYQPTYEVPCSSSFTSHRGFWHALDLSVSSLVPFRYPSIMLIYALLFLLISPIVTARRNITLDDNDPAIQYYGDWLLTPYDPLNAGGRHVVTANSDSYATFTFVGTFLGSATFFNLIDPSPCLRCCYILLFAALAFQGDYFCLHRRWNTRSSRPEGL